MEKTIEMNCLAGNELEHVREFIQDYEFKIGADGYTYEASIERDGEGNLESTIGYGILSNEFKASWDTETIIANIIYTDAEIWVDLDQHIFDADVDKTFTYYVDVEEFIKNYFFDDDELEFIKEHEENGYMEIYFTVIANEVIFDDEEE